jgi:hypothetical protein
MIDGIDQEEEIDEVRYCEICGAKLRDDEEDICFNCQSVMTRNDLMGKI